MGKDSRQRTVECDLYADATWQNLYAALQPLAKRIVYAFHVPAWQGQENDIAADIVQETIRKLIERAQKAERRDALPIYALKPMLRVIAYNYGKDIRRHDQLLSRIAEGDDAVDQPLDETENTEDRAIENAYREVLFTRVAMEVASFPAKQRLALLTDLASHMSFELQPTPLQKAFTRLASDCKTISTCCQLLAMNAINTPRCLPTRIDASRRSPACRSTFLPQMEVEKPRLPGRR